MYAQLWAVNYQHPRYMQEKSERYWKPSTREWYQQGRILVSLNPHQCQKSSNVNKFAQLMGEKWYLLALICVSFISKVLLDTHHRSGIRRKRWTVRFQMIYESPVPQLPCHCLPFTFSIEQFILYNNKPLMLSLKVEISHFDYSLKNAQSSKWWQA
jgi:hypothetical protein